MMSRKQKIRYMSSEELNSKLHKHFEKSGYFHQLRTQMRGHIVSELLKAVKPTSSDKILSSSDVDKCLLPLQVSNWLVYDHLSRQDYQYSLSTFVSEAQLPYPEKFLTAGDVLKLLGLNNAKDFESINKLYAENNEMGFLHSLLLAIVKILFLIPNKKLTIDQSTNVNGIQHLNDKNHSESAEGMLRQQASGDASFNAGLPVARQVIMNKSFSSNEEMPSDVSFQEQLHNVREENEKNIQKLRHRLLMELENLHSKEREMMLEVELTKSELRKEQSKLMKEKEMLKEKKDLMEKETVNRFEMKLREVESDFTSKLHFKDKEIETLRIKLTEKDEKLIRVETELDSEKEYHAITKRELEDFKYSHNIIKEKYASILDQNTNILRKFESMSDYSIIKDELSSKSREVSKLQSELKDIHQRSEMERRTYVETVRDLENNLSQKEPELVQAKKELAGVRSTLNAEKNVWNRERKKLEDELAKLKELYETAIEKLDDQNRNLEDLQKTNQMLNYKLTNNVLNLAKSQSFGTYENFQRPKKLFVKRSMPVPEPVKNDDSLFKIFTNAKNVNSNLQEEEILYKSRYSCFFGVSEDNKQLQSTLKNTSVIPTSRSSHTTLIKPTYLSSTSNFNDLQKPRENFLTSSNSLNDAKRMESHSLFPYNTGLTASFQTNRNLDTKVSSVIDSELNKSWKVPSSYDHNTHASNVSAASTSTTVAIGQNASSNNNKKISVLDESYGNDPSPTGDFRQISEIELSPVGRAGADDNVNTVIHANKSARSLSNRNLPSNSYKLSDLLEREERLLDPLKVSHSEFPVHNAADNFVQEKEKIENSGMPDQSIEIGKIGENNEPDNSSGKTVKNNKNTSLPYSLPDEHKSVSEELTISEHNKAKIPDLLTSQEVSKDKLESSPSVFVNLDAAWKRATVASTPHHLLKAPNRDSDIDQNSGGNSSSLANVSRKLFSSKQVSDKNITQTRSESETGDKSEITESPIDFGNKNIEEKIQETSNIRPNVSGAKNIAENISEAKHTEAYEDRTENLEVQKDEHMSKDSEKSIEKVGNSDSVSELSEIHLSCGSETEKQKEDSDAW